MMYTAFNKLGGLGDLHRKYNYELCSAIDLTKLSCVLSKMVVSGHLDSTMADMFKIQAEVLLAALRSENNRDFQVDEIIELHNPSEYIEGDNK